MMSKVLVLHYFSSGHIEAMANAAAEGARQPGAEVDVKRVPELVTEEIAHNSHCRSIRSRRREGGRPRRLRRHHRRGWHLRVADCRQYRPPRPARPRA